MSKSFDASDAAQHPKQPADVPEYTWADELQAGTLRSLLQKMNCSSSGSLAVLKLRFARCHKGEALPSDLAHRGTSSKPLSAILLEPDCADLTGISPELAREYEHFPKFHVPTMRAQKRSGAPARPAKPQPMKQLVWGPTQISDWYAQNH